MQLSEILTNVKSECGFATNIDALIRRWANRGQQKFVSSANHLFSWLILPRLILTTESNVGTYVLSPLVDTSKLVNMYSSDRRWNISIISRKEFQARFPNPATISGDPTIAYFSGFSPFHKQPSSASVLTLVSTSLADEVVVTINGLNQNGVLIREEITLDGTTPVITTNQFTRVFAKSFNAFTAGIVTITSNAGTVTNVVVSPRDRQGLFPEITFNPQPSDSGTLYYDAVMRLPPLVTDNDMSLIPEQYHDGIEDYCKYQGYLHKKDAASAAGSLALFKERVREAVADDNIGPAREIIVNGARGYNYLGEGNLPGMFPKN